MAKIKLPLTAYAHETAEVLGGCGCLLVSGTIEKANVMTIGWGLIGRLWGRPVFMVAVRPSRHTHKFIEETGEFTVNIPKKGMEEVAEYCGTVSGRDHDKFKEQALTLEKGKKVASPIISDCGIHYECKVIYKTKFIPDDVPKKVAGQYYRSGDYHTVYFGEIVAVYADKNAASNLP